MREVVIVTVDAVPGFTPVTVIRPLPLMETFLPREFVPDQAVAVSKFAICKVNPSEVELEAPKVGVFAAPVTELIDEDVAVPVSYPKRVVWTVTVDAVPGLTPVIVIKPLLTFIAADLPSELVTVHEVAVS